MLSPCSWLLMNCVFVWSLASGNPLSAAFSVFVLAVVTPPCMFTNVNRFCGFW